MSVLKQYIQSGSVSVFAKVFVLPCGLGILWLLNAVMDKVDFGLFMIALSFVLLVSGVVASAFQSLILYHGARYDEDQAAQSRALIGTSLLYAGGLAVVLALCGILGAGILADVFDKPALRHWFIYLSPMIPAHIVLLCLTTWYRARQDITRMVIYSEILPFGLRLAGLAGIWLMGGGAFHIAAVFVLSSALPVLLLYAHDPVKFRGHPRSFTAWDIRYSVKSMFTQIINKPTRGFDMMLLGALAPALAAADYAMALRLAQLLTIPKQALAQLLIPRLGKMLKTPDNQDIWQEYNASRQLTFIMTLIGCLFFVVAGPFVLGLFGTYETALPILFILCAAHLVSAAFGMAGGFVSIAGYAGWTFVIGGISSVVMLVLALVLIPVWYGEGAALAVLAGMAVTMAGFMYVIWREYKTWIINGIIALALCAAAVSFVLMAFGIMGYTTGGSVLLFAVIITGIVDRSLIKFIAKNRYGT